MSAQDSSSRVYRSAQRLGVLCAWLRADVRRTREFSPCQTASKTSVRTCAQRRDLPCGLVMHIPHASRVIPPDAMQDYLLPASAIEAEQLRVVDWFTDELYLGRRALELREGGGACHGKSIQGAIVAGVSRLVVDVERFVDDSMEPAADAGMGATYTRISGGQVLRNLSVARRTELLNRYYWPHHRKLDAAVQAALDVSGRCLLLDCHSFPTDALPTQDKEYSRPFPHICIGTDTNGHTDKPLVDMLVGHFENEGLIVDLDYPFRGTMVPNCAFGKDTRVQSVMVEIRRDLYMDELSGDRLAEKFLRMQRILQRLTHRLEWFLQHGACKAWSSATDNPHLIAPLRFTTRC